MILSEMISAIRVELQDTEPDSEVWEKDDLNRAIYKTVGLMSRLFPKKSIVETTVVRNITSENLVIALGTGTLAYKPIKVGTVAITGKTLDTHYRVNYLTGVVTPITALLLPNATYVTSYELDPHMLDLSSLLPDYIKIERLEYPAGEEPITNPTFDVIGDLLVVRGTVALIEKNHLRLTYLGKWAAPTPDEEGDYPTHLVDNIIIGSAGQALIFRAEEYLHAAVSALSSLTAPTLHVFTNPAAPTLPTAPTAPTAPTPSYSNAEGAFDGVATEITAAKAHQTTGAALANTGTRGENPAEVYARFAETLMRGADARNTEGIGRVRQQESVVNLFASEAAAYGSKVNSFANEMSGIVGKYREQVQAEYTATASNSTMVTKYQAQIAEQEMKAKNFLDIAGRYLASGQAKINEFLISLGLKVETAKQKASSEQFA